MSPPELSTALSDDQPAVITVLYPAGPEGKTFFDLDYYLSHHMPLVEEHWKPYGLMSSTVVRLPPETGWVVQTVMHFESRRQWNEALAAKKDIIMGDIPNYYEGEVTQWVGVVAEKK